MTLAKGDHLVIMRDGNVILNEGHHEYEVMEDPQYTTEYPTGSEGVSSTAYSAVSVGPLKVVK